MLRNIVEWGTEGGRTTDKKCIIFLITYRDVKAFGVINTGCGDEWLAGDASVAGWADDVRLWVALVFEWTLRSDRWSWSRKPTHTRPFHVRFMTHETFVAQLCHTWLQSCNKLRNKFWIRMCWCIVIWNFWLIKLMILTHYRNLKWMSIYNGADKLIVVCVTCAHIYHIFCCS